MKHLIWISLQLFATICFSQPDLFYYEQNLSLYGNPSDAEEFYYEYHTQAKAHYYSHHMSYDPQGRIKTHVKTNVGLLDSIPLTFQGIIDTRPMTITYSFEYNERGQYTHFVRHQFQEEVGTFQQDEIRQYDSYGMLTRQLFQEVNGTDTVVKNPSTKRIIYRDASHKVTHIEKYTFSFADKGLILSEITSFGYLTDKIDTISVFQIGSSGPTLKGKKYGLMFQSYHDLNTDSLLFLSYSMADVVGDVTKHAFSYDTANRMLHHAILDSTGAFIAQSNWSYEPFKTTESTSGRYRLEVYTDETGYERYREEFQNDYSLAVPADMNTRTVENGRIQHALSEVWDPVTLFYRKDTEYFYSYGDMTGLLTRPALNNRLSVYPNPSSGTIHLPESVDIERLEICSVEGKVSTLTPNVTIQLDLPKGIYLLNAWRKDGSYQSMKLLVE